MTAAQADCLAATLNEGHQLLRRGMPAMGVVEEAIRLLEGSGLFNAGRGSNRQLDGIRRMDASIMEGRTLKAGAVASIEGIVHPITAARLVLEETGHVLLVGPSASRFAEHFGLERLPRKQAPRASRKRREGLTVQADKIFRLHRALLRRGRLAQRALGKETVGAVALDRRGTLAAGASTGGVDVMLPGRVGDTPLIGCGVYADNLAGAVSMTGLGESIIRIAAAKELTDLLARGLSPAAASRKTLASLTRRTHGAAGALILAPDGRFAIRHTTPVMAAGYCKGDGRPVVQGRFAPHS
ncbi:MAG: isoaspartyl peptidase/L-asparaginase [Nitrospiraceae bacterium]|nr:isoaspartyl peptidase/L-asparaginase [Nitrospiraceae bacterium]